MHASIPKQARKVERQGDPAVARETPRLFRPVYLTLVVCFVLSVCGCTTLREYVENGFKVGPNFKQTPAAVAGHWIDSNDVRVRSEEWDDSHWWTVFNDPILNDLVQSAYRQNLTLREASFRVMENRAQLGIAIGEIMPQTQVMNGGWQHKGVSVNVANRIATPQRWFSQWDYGFGLQWEIDFWGRIRRAIESAEDTLDATVENYDDVLVTLIGDVATSYVQIRTLQQQIAYARQDLELQKQSLIIATAKFKGGQASQMDVSQGQSDVSTTEGLIEQNLIQLRQSTNQLCVLLGIPPEDLILKIGDAAIPTAPPEVIAGVPADLLRRRPDVRKAERTAAAQSAQIGVAEADFYPQMTLNGTLGWSSQEIVNLMAEGSFRGAIAPSFQWPILNYGRILNNVREQEAKFQELVAGYQQTVLTASQEVENGLVTYLRAHNRTRDYVKAVNSEMAAFRDAMAQYQGGLVDYNRVVLIQERLVERQQLLAESQGEIALGLIQVYRALGGGWQIRLDCEGADGAPLSEQPMESPAEPLPAPKVVEKMQ